MPHPPPLRLLAALLVTLSCPLAAHAAEPEGFAGESLLVGRAPPRPVAAALFEFGIDAQAAPFNLLLSKARSDYLSQGIAAACANSTQPDCAAKSQQSATQALQVLRAMPQAQFDQVKASVGNPKQLAQSLKAAGVGNPAQVQAVTNYVAQVPVAQRNAAIGLARYAVQNEASDLRLEPYARLALPGALVRIGVPLSLGLSSGTGSRAELGNINLELQKDWQFRTSGATYAVATGLGLYLPTATGDQPATAMADLFQASKHLNDRLALAPFATAGVDVHWLTLQTHVQLVSQHRVRGVEVPASVQYLQGGVGAVLGPRSPLALIAELNGLAGLHDADAYRSLFAVAGLRLRVGPVRLGVGAQVPVWDGAKADLGSWQGADFGTLARISLVTRLSVGF